MEEIRSLALAYYAHGSPKIRKMFHDFFEEMDPNRKGSVTKAEFTRYVKENCPGISRPDLFTELDQDGSGSLDFQEIITFCYLVTLRSRWCDGKNCQKLIKNVYFGCAECFFDKTEEGSFDLCLGCYRNKNYVHEHEFFLDNYVMLTIAQNEWKKEPESPTTMVMDVSSSPDNERSRSTHAQAGYNPFQQLNSIHEPYYNPYQQLNAIQDAYANYYMQHSTLMNQYMIPSNSGIHFHTQVNSSPKESSLLEALKAFNTVGNVASLASVAACTIM